MAKTIFALLALALVLVAVTGCSSKQEIAPPTTTPPTTETTTQPDTTAANTAIDSSGVAADDSVELGELV